jgi:hypothetical protein
MFRRGSFYIFILWFIASRADGQELFPMTEPASSTPSKGVLSLRMFGESYNEVDRMRNLFGLKITYGLTAKLTVSATPNISNHHNRDLPPEFPDHNTPQIGVSHPYLFNGVDFYAKYRILGIDREKNHFRVALYGEYSYLTTAHDEAEPTLLDDTKGYGAGFITTYLVNHFAASFTGGVILPAVYSGTVPDIISVLPGVPAKVTYGNAYNYDLSFGYLLFPDAYSSYRQTSWSVYMEFLGKSYTAAEVQVANLAPPYAYYTISTRNNHALQAGSYVELYPGLQSIIRSNLRADFSVGFPVYSKSYAHFYPVYNIGVQRYFYSRHKK